HVPVVPDGLVDDTLPALPLREELPYRVGPLGGTDVVRQAVDLVVAALAQELLVDPERELDVLARERARVAADLLENIAPPDLEGADGTEHEAEPRPGKAVVEEGAQVIQVLVSHERPPVDGTPPGRRSPRTRRVLCDREVARHTDDPRRILDHSAHPLQQPLAGENRA